MTEDRAAATTRGRLLDADVASLRAHGTAGLYGTFDRANYAFVVQTTGTLLY